MKTYLLLLTTTLVNPSTMAASATQRIDPSTLSGKVMHGYQGWFSADGDGSNSGWKHWSRVPEVIPQNGSLVFDLWPDLTEFPPSLLYDTNLFYADGSRAGVFSAYNYGTVDIHMSWMEEHGLDGVFLQRFVSELPFDFLLHFRNQVTKNIMQACEAHGRTFAIMYDISGANPATLREIIENDWRMLVDEVGVLQSSQYQHHNGKPVAAIWGFGFTDRDVSIPDSLQIISNFKSGVFGDPRYAVTLMGGVPYYWREEINDSLPGFLQVYREFDIIAPWGVGRYARNVDYDNLFNGVVRPDLEYISQNLSSTGYAPLIFPGFSWANLRNDVNLFNEIPRNGGDFFCHQAMRQLGSNATFIYIAMFDEVDEATAIFKGASTRADTPSSALFLSFDVDGANLPSDHFLRLAGDITRIQHSGQCTTSLCQISDICPSLYRYTDM